MSERQKTVCLFCCIAHKIGIHLIDMVGWEYNIRQSYHEHEEDYL